MAPLGVLIKLLCNTQYWPELQPSFLSLEEGPKRFGHRCDDWHYQESTLWWLVAFPASSPFCLLHYYSYQSLYHVLPRIRPPKSNVGASKTSKASAPKQSWDVHIRLQPRGALSIQSTMLGGCEDTHREINMIEASSQPWTKGNQILIGSQFLFPIFTDFVCIYSTGRKKTIPLCNLLSYIRWTDWEAIGSWLLFPASPKMSADANGQTPVAK